MARRENLQQINLKYRLSDTNKIMLNLNTISKHKPVMKASGYPIIIYTESSKDILTN